MSACCKAPSTGRRPDSTYFWLPTPPPRARRITIGQAWSACGLTASRSSAPRWPYSNGCIGPLPTNSAPCCRFFADWVRIDADRQGTKNGHPKMPEGREAKTVLVVISRFAMRGQVEAFALFLIRHTQTDHDIDQFVGQQRDYAGPDNHGTDTPQLTDDLGVHVIRANGVGDVVIDARAAKGRVGKHAGQDGAEDAADAMDAENVKGIVSAKHLLQAIDTPQADGTRQQADDDGPHHADKAGSRGNRHQAGNGTGGCAQHRGLALEDPFGKHPGQRRAGRGNPRVDHGQGSTAGGFESGAGVEAEPAE